MNQGGEVRRRINPVIVVKVLSQVVVDPQSGCWVIPGRENKYKRVTVEADGWAEQTHRYIYEIFVGPIQPGLFLDHVCGKRGCMNPFHLEPVTTQVNIRRGRAGLRGAAKTHCVRGHPLSGENLSISYNGGRAPVRRCKACEAERSRRRRAKIKEERAREAESTGGRSLTQRQKAARKSDVAKNL